tara:strand:- start:42562 stop:42717 length:156 start_codon:yes stop_codon:yes gene_type:complete
LAESFPAEPFPVVGLVSLAENAQVVRESEPELARAQLASLDTGHWPAQPLW